jgi:hypothetical protein
MSSSAWAEAFMKLSWKTELRFSSIAGMWTAAR